MPQIGPDTVPYPPGPDPDLLSLRHLKPGRSLLGLEALLLAGHALFLAAYAAVILLAAYGAYFLIQRADFSVAGVAAGLGAAVAVLVGAFLAAGLFRGSRATEEPASQTVKPETEPGLFAFLQRVGDDAGSGLPHAVKLTPTAAAAVIPQVTLLNLILPPKKELHLGLGLVNALNLSELQAVVAHEFAHFSQREQIAAYCRVVESVTDRLLSSNAAIDRLDAFARKHKLGVLIHPITAAPRIVLSVLAAVHRAMGAARGQLIREREFQADRIAAGVAGSNVLADAIRAADHAAAAMTAAIDDARYAASRGHFTADLFFQQHAHLRQRGADRGAIGSTGPRPDADERIAQLSRMNLTAPVDERTPWLLFSHPAEVRREATARLLRTWPEVPRGANLADPRAVQKLIDTERAEIAFDAKYGGAFDGRLLQFAWADVEKAASNDGLTAVEFPDLKELLRRRNDLLRRRRRLLERISSGAESPSLAAIATWDDRVAQVERGFRGHDLSLLHAHFRTAAAAGRSSDFVEWYRLLLSLQDLCAGLGPQADRCAAYIRGVDPRDSAIDPNLFNDYVVVIRAARAAIAKTLDRAARLDEPALARFERHGNLRELILDADVIGDLPPGPIRPEWTATLERQLLEADRRLRRLHARCLVEILKQFEPAANAAPPEPAASESDHA